MATNEISDEGARNKEELERKERVLKLIEEEEKRYRPAWQTQTFA